MDTHPAKKIAAAMAAVIQYLAEAQIDAAVPAGRPPTAAVASASPWGAAGRQESMMLRDLWQRRIPRSW